MPFSRHTPELPPLQRRALLEGMGLVVQLLGAAPGSSERVDGLEQWQSYEAALREWPPGDMPLMDLARRLGLGSFEIQVLLVLLATHVVPEMQRLVGQADDKPLAVGVTVRTVIAHLLSDPDARMLARRVFQPGAPLVDRYVVTLGVLEGHSEDSLLDRPLLICAPVVRYCLGEAAVPRLRTGLYTLQWCDRTATDVVLPRAEFAGVRALIRRCQRRSPGDAPRVLISGPVGTGKTSLAEALCNSLDRPMLRLDASGLPQGPGLEEALRDAFTDAWLTDAVVLVDACEAALHPESPRRKTFLDALDGYGDLVLLCAAHPEQLDAAVERRLSYNLLIPVPDVELRTRLWELMVPADVVLAPDVSFAGLAARYDFTGARIHNALSYAHALAKPGPDGARRLTASHLEQGCRAQLPQSNSALTIQLRGHHRLSDIVLPEKTRQRVDDLLGACRNQGTVLGKWGFGRRLATGKGIIALFDGPPGTGKTFCAEILANELGRPLQRVNVAEVVSKWVGETEKHVFQIFQNARLSQGVLLFDEADAMFGSRSAEAKTASDRQSNTVVNLLLQEIERFPGVCILTTNFFQALDKALVRRIQFRVTFEQPDVGQRKQIWEVLTPSEVPLGPHVDFGVLARDYELTGAMIKNALLRGAYRACDHGDSLTMEHLRLSCQDEYVATGKLVRG